MSRILNWAVKSYNVLSENIARDGVKQVAFRIYKNFGQFKFGTLVGVDEFGNKYYEDNEPDNTGNGLVGRNRWVEYPVLNRYKISGSKIPPEWHSWLHFITDIPGPEMKKDFEKPRYKLAYQENQTATPNAYAPANYMKKPTYNVATAMGVKPEQVKGKRPVPKAHSFTADEL